MGRRRGELCRAPSGVLTGHSHRLWLEARQNGERRRGPGTACFGEEGDKDYCALSKHAGTILGKRRTGDHRRGVLYHVYLPCACEWAEIFRDMKKKGCGFERERDLREDTNFATPLRLCKRPRLHSDQQRHRQRTPAFSFLSHLILSLCLPSPATPHRPRRPQTRPNCQSSSSPSSIATALGP
jgi:hypothetical protein